jgi:predicted acylesterase/phospholipase RssA
LAGSSAGALTAMALAAGVPMAHALELSVQMAQGLRPGLLGAFGMKDPLRGLLEELLPPDIHRRASGRVHVGVVWLDGPSYRWELVSDFTSRSDVLEALLASCHVPFWFDGGNLSTRFRGRAAMDGGLSPNFMPAPPGSERAVRVTCIPNFPGADIAPGVLTPAGFSMSQAVQFALTKQSADTMRALYAQGGTDAAEWRRRFYDPLGELGDGGSLGGAGAAQAAPP